MKNLFFTVQFYRKLWLLNLKAKITAKAMLPISLIKVVWKTIKLYRNYPNKWDRYVKLKEEEEEAEELRRKEEMLVARSNFIGAAFRITFCQLIEINPEHTKEKKEENFAEFQQSRKELQAAIEQLEGYGESIPEELKADLLETPIDRFTSIEEWEMFTESFNQKINDF